MHGAPLPFTGFPFSDDRNHLRQVNIYPDMGGVTCPDGNAPIVTCQWRINSVIYGVPWWIQCVRVTKQTNSLQDTAGIQPATTSWTLVSV